MNIEEQFYLITRVSVFAAVTSIVVDLIVGLAIWRMTGAQSKISDTLIGISMTMQQISEIQKSISITQHDQVNMQQALMMQVAVLDAKASTRPNDYGAESQR